MGDLVRVDEVRGHVLIRWGSIDTFVGESGEEGITVINMEGDN